MRVPCCSGGGVGVGSGDGPACPSAGAWFCITPEGVLYRIALTAPGPSLFLSVVFRRRRSPLLHALVSASVPIDRIVARRRRVDRASEDVRRRTRVSPVEDEDVGVACTLAALLGLVSALGTDTVEHKSYVCFHTNNGRRNTETTAGKEARRHRTGNAATRFLAESAKNTPMPAGSARPTRPRVR